MAYHWRTAVHHADHLDTDPLLVHVLKQPHHLTHTQPLAVGVAHSNNVVTLFQTISLVEEQDLRGGTLKLSDVGAHRVNISSLRSV